MHQRDNDEYIDFYFAAKQWRGEPTNCEPEKCDDMLWAPLSAPPDNTIPNVKQALDAYSEGKRYSEFGWE